MTSDRKPYPAFLLYRLSFMELWRNKFGLLLLLVIPAVFLAVVEWTSGSQTMFLDLYFHDSTRQVLLTHRDVNLVFIGAAVSGFLTAYYALILFHRHFEYFRYCIGMGLRPISFLGSRFLFFLTVVAFLATLISLITGEMIPVEQPAGMVTGFLYVGIIYGTFGGIMGLVSRDFMVAILGVVLLANLDAGWLQNPVFYTYAQNNDVIQWLPAFYPTQLVFTSAFTDTWNGWAAQRCSLFAAGMIAALFGLLHLKTRSVKSWWNR